LYLGKYFTSLHPFTRAKESDLVMYSINSEDLSLESVRAILDSEQNVDISSETLAKMKESFDFLSSFAQNKVIYGVNTGFGPMAPYVIEESGKNEIQFNLIRSHCSGAGNTLDKDSVKAAMIARLKSISLGYSGVDHSAVFVLRDMINKDVYPVIYEHGGVGASGDLVQLAHLALVMIGEGDVLYQDKIQPTSDVFSALGINPMKIKIREGLAIINGTSVMTGIGIVNFIRAQRALEWSVLASSMISQIIESYDDYFSESLNGVKKHKGQFAIAKAITREISQSSLIRKRETQLFNKPSETILDDKVQEYYSIRCVPQISGAILEEIWRTKEVLENELNSANDNPIVDAEGENVFHGGNFHGDYVSFQMDKLKIGMTKLSMLAERQLNYLLNPKLNGILPPFVNLGRMGQNFGMQGIQFTATSTAAENQMLSNPMSVHSIPSNNDNQDIVSMGTNSALAARKIIDNTFEVLAIELVTIAQAIDYLQIESELSLNSLNAYKQIRNIIPVFKDDKPLYKELRELKKQIINTKPIAIDG